MRPERQELVARLRTVLARVRWENVALLAIVAVALIAVVVSGELAGRDSSPLPADVGLREKSLSGRGATQPRRHGTRPKSGPTKGASRRRRHRRGVPRSKRREKGRDRAHRRGRGQTLGGARPPAVGPPPLPEPPLPASPGSGGEFAPD